MNKSTLSWFLSCKLASLYKLSFIIGSYAAFFTGANIANPLIGAFNSRLQTLLLFSLLFVSKFLFTGSISFQFLAFILPGMFAAFYWNVKGPLIRLIVPSLCFVLFLIHPTGLQAAPYACYWLIPIALYFKKHDNLFLHSLSSTFVAHAVGSVIWIYSTPMTAAMWLGLIPIVFLERMSFAAGIAVCHLCLTHGKELLPQKQHA